MGYSLARKTSKSDRSEYQGYLVSNAWRARRRKYFEWVKSRGFEPACQVCFGMLNDLGSLDLHHMSYDGVIKLPHGKYRAEETNDDLVPLCREHHEALHQRLDDHRYSYWGWDRRRATVVIINYMRRDMRARTKGQQR